ncbi:MAG: site-specific integrase [Aliarcobacter sp.]|nr:site-specific integrase [Aliarcobacter sp.]
MENIKYIYGDLKFTIKEQFGHWYLDFYSSSGKRQRGSTKLKATAENLKIIKKQVIPDIYEGIGKEPIPREKEIKNWNLEDFAIEFFELKKNKIREHTLKRNIMHFNKHISPYFGKKELKNLTPLGIERWQNELEKKYKSSTIVKLRTIFSEILKKAKDNDLIDRNIFEKVPGIQKQNISEVNPFTEKELNHIITNTNGYMKNFIQLMVATGMRPGEIVGLKWSDIDFERKKIDIERTRIRSIKKGEIKDGEVKTASSERGADMLILAEEALLRQKELTFKYEYIFINQSKRPFYSHDIIGLNFRKILKKNGIKERPIYNLRHVFASQLISKGADIAWVSKMLGHKDITITLKVYTKFIKEDDEVRIKKIAQMDKFMVKLENRDN